MPGQEQFSGIPESGASLKVTQPFAGQKPGTSGLRKKTREFMQPGYFTNFVQSVFDCLPEETYRGGTLLVAGDGRFWCNEAIKKICSLAAGNGVGRVWIAKDGLAMTPACSAIIRLREEGVAFGGFILTASHNPGGIDNDFGVKFNTANGAPAQPSLMDAVYERTQQINRVKHVKLLDFEFDSIGTKVLIKGQFKVEVIDGVEDWLSLMSRSFHFPALRRMITSANFKFIFDAMSGVSGPAAHTLFVETLGAQTSSIMNGTPLPDFGGHHPDPNLEYAKELVKRMHIKDPENISRDTCDFGAACDGDSDRNMILGRGFFVTPSDSVAIIALHAEKCMPYCMPEHGTPIAGLARSMPTSTALNKAAEILDKRVYETPTGWKFFTNLMDSGLITICGEESFGTGSIHVREKDGLWAVLCWLSILAYRNGYMENIDTEIRLLKEGRPLPEPILPPRKVFLGVQEITESFWKECGRIFYMRYDYENKSLEGGESLMSELTKLTHLSEVQRLETTSALVGDCVFVKIEKIEVFKYVDPVDGSIADNQGIILFFKGGRIIWRLSGTGSSGATIRVYFELEAASEDIHKKAEVMLKDIITFATRVSRIKEFLGTDIPTVIT